MFTQGLRACPPTSRFTIWVDDEEIPAGSGVGPLANVAVSTTITSTNGVPIIVERTMWWPGPEIDADYWTEAHNSPGATATGTRWALAEGELGGAQDAETYILIANTSADAGTARVTLYFENGTPRRRTFTRAAEQPHERAVSADFPDGRGQALRRADREPRRHAGADCRRARDVHQAPAASTWAAGTNALATRLQ